ncbi:MAG: glycosyltransferase [Ignavibacteriaceae bacterium]
MKILFINKYDITGGAGVAAFRLHKALEKRFNTTDRFLVGIKKSNLEIVIPTRKPGLHNFIERGLNFVFNQAGFQYKFHPFSTKTILNFAEEFRPDIISLHNAHGGYFQTSLLIQLSKIAPIAWTLHDMWAFTANAAHTFDDDSWKFLRSGKGEKNLFPQIGLNTGDWLIKQKKNIYMQSNLIFISPSKWLYELALQSPVIKNKNIFHVHNGIDLNIFCPQNKASIRESLGIPADAKVLVFGAEKIFGGNYKGGDDLLNILEVLNINYKIKVHLIIIGISKLKSFERFENFVVHQTGYIFDEDMMAKYLSAADVFIYPTRADNLPTALIEASACGVPSVTYDVGGCKEIIRDGSNGYVVPYGQVNLFVDKVKVLLENEELKKNLSNNAIKVASEKFSVDDMADKYYGLFEKLSALFSFL